MLRLLFQSVSGILGAACAVGLITAIGGMGISIVHPGGCVLGIGRAELNLGNLDEQPCFAIGYALMVLPILVLGVVGVSAGTAVFDSMKQRGR